MRAAVLSGHAHVARVRSGVGRGGGKVQKWRALECVGVWCEAHKGVFWVDSSSCFMWQLISPKSMKALKETRCHRAVAEKSKYEKNTSAPAGGLYAILAGWSECFVQPTSSTILHAAPRHLLLTRCARGTASSHLFLMRSCIAPPSPSTFSLCLFALCPSGTRLDLVLVLGLQPGPKPEIKGRGMGYAALISKF